MMNELAPQNRFEAERLDKSKYTLSLAEEALRSELCSDEEYSSLEQRIYEKLADHIILYTGGESTSVENSTAAMLLSSILYNTDLALMQLHPYIAVKRLLGKPLDDIYYSGLRINREFTLKALSKLREVKRTRINVPCVVYNILLNETLGGLICSNDVKFDAKRNFTNVNYPLPTVNGAVCGIGGILHMLDELLTENHFVNSFDRGQCSALFNRYIDEIAHPAGAKINLGQLTFKHAVLSIMAGNREPILPLSETDAHKLAGYSYKGDESFLAATNASRRLYDRAPEKYISRLLTKIRAPLNAIFAGGETSIRKFAGIC